MKADSEQVVNVTDAGERTNTQKCPFASPLLTKEMD